MLRSLPVRSAALGPTRSAYLTITSALTILALSACNDDGAAGPATRVLTTVTVTVPTSTFEVGEIGGATASGFDQNGEPIATGPVTWDSDQQTIAAVNPVTGFILGIAEGTTRITATAGGKIGERPITVKKAAAVRINEIQPRAETPNGWLELSNPTTDAVDLSGWSMVDNNFFGPPYVFPAGTTIPPGGLLVIEESSLPFGLDAADSAHLFSKFGVQVDAAAWANQPATTFGLCPNQAGPVLTTAPTKGTANACPQ
jgi:hypothetical protein